MPCMSRLSQQSRDSIVHAFILRLAAIYGMYNVHLDPAISRNGDEEGSCWDDEMHQDVRVVLSQLSCT